MKYNQRSSLKITLTFKQMLGMLIPYVKKKIWEQIKAIWLIILYLVLFQTFILKIPITQSSIITVGIFLVIIGLTFFMEGLLLGLMPLGEIIGIKLPQKAKLPVILLFSFILGVGATFAEPAISILQLAGSSIKAWEAPLLFVLLNKFSSYLVLAVGTGVGFAVIFGMARFLYNWSLKTFIYIVIPTLLIISIIALFDPNLIHLTGLAWDCGGVTTGPVTVPLVLVLGIGICRIVKKGHDSGCEGFGVVTLASSFPILTVMLLGIILLPHVPHPMSEEEFLNPKNHSQVIKLFNGPDEMTGHVLQNASEKGQLIYFKNNKNNMLTFLKDLAQNTQKQLNVFGQNGINTFAHWAINKSSHEQKSVIFKSNKTIKSQANQYLSSNTKQISSYELTMRKSVAALRAIIPLCIFLLFMLIVVLKEKIPKKDELFLGIAFALVGMALFNIGIELGLSQLGNQVGKKLPAAFTTIQVTDQKMVISNFDTTILQTAISDSGKTEQFFYIKKDNRYGPLYFHPSGLDKTSRQYHYTPQMGPLFGGTNRYFGILIVLIFAFIMGYGATLAEPALNALGVTVEEVTIGAFKKNLLMQAVAVGVGIGIAMGFTKIIWNIPLIWLLAPPYLLLIVLSKISPEYLVNIGWDSAGVTTGPITVPLVLAMGLGLSGQIQVTEGFGILSLASVYPILSVLLVSLWLNRRQITDFIETDIKIK